MMLKGYYIIETKLLPLKIDTGTFNCLWTFEWENISTKDGLYIF